MCGQAAGFQGGRVPASAVTKSAGALQVLKHTLLASSSDLDGPVFCPHAG